MHANLSHEAVNKHFSFSCYFLFSEVLSVELACPRSPLNSFSEKLGLTEAESFPSINLGSLKKKYFKLLTQPSCQSIWYRIVQPKLSET